MQINIEKKYAVLIFIGLLALAGSWAVYAVDNTQGWHSWSQLSDKPVYSCSGSDEALKTINLDTGAVTCEDDDAGGSSDWDSITGKPAGFADDVDNERSVKTALYKTINSNCGGDKISISSTCMTRRCCIATKSLYNDACVKYGSFDCNGKCMKNVNTCNNELIGYLVN